jgi:hypothetical protein
MSTFRFQPLTFYLTVFVQAAADPRPADPLYTPALVKNPSIRPHLDFVRIGLGTDPGADLFWVKFPAGKSSMTSGYGLAEG